MIINLINKNSAKILLLFSTSPGRKYLRKEIQEKTEINNVPLDSSLAELLSFKLIIRKGRIYSLNLENSLIIQILEELKEFSTIPLKVKFILNEIVFYVSKINSIKSMILFGSYAKLIYSEKSDIDIAVILDNKVKNKKIIEEKIESFSEKIGKKYKKQIEVHLFLEKNMKEKDPLIKDILRNGKKIL